MREKNCQICTGNWLPRNQPNLLNKYYINKGFSYFRGSGALPGINTLVHYQIDVVKSGGFSYKKIIFIWHWFYFYQLILILEDGNNDIYFLLYFLYKINLL